MSNLNAGKIPKEAFEKHAIKVGLCLNTSGLVGEPMRFSAETEEAANHFHAGYKAAKPSQADLKKLARRIAKKEMDGDFCEDTEEDVYKVLLQLLTSTLGKKGELNGL